MSGTAYEPARCVVCGHTDADVIATAEDIRDEQEMLWEYHGARLHGDTPPRRLIDRVAFSEPPPLAVVRCRECGLVYRNPVERSHELREIYAGDTPASDALRSLHDTQRPAMDAQARRLRDVLGRGGSGLEVGSYVGAFLAAARDVGLEMEGVDVNADVNAFTRSLGFTVHDGELTAMPADRDGRTDAIAVWNTFDQLQSPREAVAAARRLLRHDGVLAIRVPNGAFYARLRSLLTRGGVRRSVAGALLAQNNLLGFPYRAGFTPSSLSRFVGENGFHVERVVGDTLVPVADEWTRLWARAEERIIKVLLRLAAHGAEWAPWFELYARRI